MPLNSRPSPTAALLGSFALTAGLAIAAAPAFAQQPPATPPQGAPPAPGQPAGPVKLDLQPTSGQNWTKLCGNAGPNRQVCFTTRDFTQAPDQPPLIAMAVYDVKGEDPIVRFLMPPGLLIRPGIRFSADKGPQQDAAYTICLPNGCFAENKVKASAIDAMKKATSLSILARNSVNAEVTFTVPMAGFGKAFDGPAIDPKVLQQEQEAQQKALQEQLEAQAKKQREMLEKGGAGTTGTPPAPATPPTTPPKP